MVGGGRSSALSGTDLDARGQGRKNPPRCSTLCPRAACSSPCTRCIPGPTAPGPVQGGSSGIQLIDLGRVLSEEGN